MKTYLLKLWASLNYRYCCTQQYLKTQQHDILDAVYWSRQADYWQKEYLK